MTGFAVFILAILVLFAICAGLNALLVVAGRQLAPRWRARAAGILLVVYAATWVRVEAARPLLFLVSVLGFLSWPAGRAAVTRRR